MRPINKSSEVKDAARILGICPRSLCFGVTRDGRYRAPAGNRLTRSPIDPSPPSRAGERQSSLRDFLDTSSVVGNRNFDRVQERRTKDGGEKDLRSVVWFAGQDELAESEKESESTRVCVCVCTCMSDRTARRMGG